MTTPAPIYHLALRDLHAAAGATFAFEPWLIDAVSSALVAAVEVTP